MFGFSNNHQTMFLWDSILFNKIRKVHIERYPVLYCLEGELFLWNGGIKPAHNRMDSFTGLVKEPLSQTVLNETVRIFYRICELIKTFII